MWTVLKASADAQGGRARRHRGRHRAERGGATSRRRKYQGKDAVRRKGAQDHHQDREEKSRDALKLDAEIDRGVGLIAPAAAPDAHARQMSARTKVPVAFRSDAAFLVFGDPRRRP